MFGLRTSLPSRAVRSQRELIAQLAFAVHVVLAPELLGGVLPSCVLAITGGAILALGLSLWASPGRGLPREVLFGCMAFALGFTALQALPLPCGLVRFLARDSADQLARAYALIGDPAPSFCMLSRDPGGTREEILKGIAIVATYASAVRLVRNGQRRNVLRALALSGALLAAVTLGHALVGAHEVFGIYAPTQIRSQPFLSPLLNLNTLGGALVLCVPLAIALALSCRGGERLFWVTAALLMGLTVMLTRSRGAVGALVFALLLIPALIRRARLGATGARLYGAARLTQLAAPVGVVAAVAISLYGTYAGVLEEFRTGDWDKLRLIRVGAGFALDHALLGVGRGAFGSAFSAVHNTVNRFEYAENFVVQWAAEWGLVVTGALLLALALSWLRSMRSAQTYERVGALAGVLALALQNLVDLGIELAGVATLAAAVLAAAVGERRAGSGRDSSAVRGLIGYGVTAAFAVLLIGLGPGVLRDHGPTLESRLRRQLNGASRSEFRTTLVRFVRAHPSHPIYAVLAAAEALKQHDRDAGRWINRGLQLAPGWGAPHAQAAQWLWNGGHRKQALLELALSGKADLYGTRDLACAVAKVDPDGVIGIAGRTSDRGLFLELVSTCLPADSPGAEKLDAEIMRVAPEWPQAFARQASRLVQRGQLEAALELAHKATLLARTTAPDDISGIIVETRVLFALKRFDEAERTIRTGIRVHPDSMSLRGLQVDVATLRGDRDELNSAIIAMRGLAHGAAELADVYRLEATSERKLGNLATALRAYEEAYQIASDRGALRSVAELAEALGDRRRAMRARVELCNLDPKDDSCALVPRAH